jgi:prevent-host-death family protein
MAQNFFPTAMFPSAELIEEEALQLSEARASFTKLVGQAEKQQRSVIMKHGKPVAAIVPLADLERLRALDLERRNKMTFRKNHDTEVVDFVSHGSESVLPGDETISRLAHVLAGLIAQNDDLRALISGDGRSAEEFQSASEEFRRAAAKQPKPAARQQAARYAEE